ncbi:MAG: flagellar basal body P-ring protein FlgI, partial [Burkholderiaceae bacterium]
MNPLHDTFGDPHNTWRNDATDQVDERSDRVVRVLIFLAGILASAAMWWPAPAHATRIKEVATIQGVRSNPLVGYGLVVGLDGTGDQTTSTPFTTQSINAMLQQMGVTVPPGTN